MVEGVDRKVPLPGESVVDGFAEVADGEQGDEEPVMERKEGTPNTDKSLVE